MNDEFINDLFKKYEQMMYNVAIEILKNRSDAEDAVQIAFLWIIKNTERISEIPRANLVFYFESMMEHISINIIKKKKRHTTANIVEHMNVMAKYSVEEKAADNLFVEEIMRALDELSDTDYSIMYLYIIMQEKPIQIAKELGLSENGIRVRVERTKKKLIKILKERGFNYDI